MNKVLTIIIAGLFLFSGCAVVRVPGEPRHGHHRRELRRAECHPSQYWDGDECRHKGKGHGARKHDGRGHRKHGRH
ncbi:MAG: hypothetical protein WBV82_01190 [Myxococcaceae bacterium]